MLKVICRSSFLCITPRAHSCLILDPLPSLQEGTATSFYKQCTLTGGWPKQGKRRPSRITLEALHVQRFTDDEAEAFVLTLGLLFAASGLDGFVAARSRPTQASRKVPNTEPLAAEPIIPAIALICKRRKPRDEKQRKESSSSFWTALPQNLQENLLGVMRGAAAASNRLSTKNEYKHGAGAHCHTTAG